jgi:uncharacterized protein YlxW (UPF0749 family)
MKRSAFIWSLTGISAAIGFMLTVQISSRPQSSSDQLTSYLDLRTQIQEQLQENQVLEEEIAKQNALLLKYKSSAGETSKLLDALKQDAKSVEAAAGLTSVTGPGITIKIQYDPSLPHDGDTGDVFDLIADQEIGLIVNYLFANGAKAISINGQRLVTTSSIRVVQGLDESSAVLQVNTVPVTMPYVITAVGDIDKMKAVLTLYNVVEGLRTMQQDCIIKEYPGPNGVTVPAYDGPLPGHWAKEVNNG